MPVAKGAPLDPAATRARILDTATRLFYDRGVHAVGVNEIAARAHASKLSLYRFFPSKQHLVAAMLVERSDRVHAWLRRESSNAPPGPARVLSVFDLLTEWFAQPGYRGCAVVNAATDTRGDQHPAAGQAEDKVSAGVCTGSAATPDQLRMLARDHLARYRDLLEERLAELDPPPADRDRLARQMLLLIEGATTVCSIESPGISTAGTDARDAATAILRASRTVEPDQSEPEVRSA